MPYYGHFLINTLNMGKYPENKGKNIYITGEYMKKKNAFPTSFSLGENIFTLSF